jgi:hypothetical protein
LKKWSVRQPFLPLYCLLLRFAYLTKLINLLNLHTATPTIALMATHSPYLKPFAITGKRMLLYKSYPLSKLPTPSPISIPVFKTQIVHRIFLVFSQFALKNHQFFRRPHTAFKLFFNCYTYEDVIMLNMKKFFSRWENTLSLIFLVVHNNCTMLLCGNRLFWNETLLFNWLFFKKSFTTDTFFMQSLMFPTKKSKIISAPTKERLQSFSPEVAMILDLRNYKPITPFLNSYFTFSIALTPLSANPHLVNYPIPIAENSLLVQFFFLKLLLFITSLAKLNRYQSLQRSWFYKNLN